MTLKAVLDNLEGVDEALHSEYKLVAGKYLLDVDGMVTTDNVTRATEALRKERNDHSLLKRTWAPVAAVANPEDVLAALDKLPDLEAQVAAGTGADPKKVDELVETRIKGRLAPVTRELEQTKVKLGEAEGQIAAFQTEKKQTLISTAIRKAAAVSKVVDPDDILAIGTNLFELAEDGSVVTREAGGVTAGITPEMWLSDMKEKKPHWWGESIGGGARPGIGGAGGANPFTHDSWNLTEQGKLVRADSAKASRLAKAAGTTVGGPRPAKK